MKLNVFSLISACLGANFYHDDCGTSFLCEVDIDFERRCLLPIVREIIGDNFDFSECCCLVVLDKESKKITGIIVDTLIEHTGIDISDITDKYEENDEYMTVCNILYDAAVKFCDI